MKNLITTVFLLASLVSTAQLELTLSGDPTDPGIIKKKEHLESKGYKVKVRPADAKEAVTGDKAFIEKWTNEQLPAFEFVDVNGERVSSEEMKGKYIHIHFWSVTCGPCIQEFPELNQLKEKYGEDVIYLAFAPEPEAKVNKVLKNHPLQYQTVANTASFFKELGIGGYPKNFFVNPEGNVVKVTDGTHFKAEMRNGEMVMVPDNFKIYDEIIERMISMK